MPVAVKCLVLLFFLLTHTSALASQLKSDERIIFFPTSASLDEKTGVWDIPIHGWIFEPEEDSIWRSLMVQELFEWLELSSDSVDNEIFRRRARMFLVDNERGKQFAVKIGETSVEMKRSEPNGHFRQNTAMKRGQFIETVSEGWLPFYIDSAQTGGLKVVGQTQVVPPKGLSVISDIDDTIKISGVLDKKVLLENTFLKEFKPVPGMSRLYHRWELEGAVFHYVSASPWQLYPELAKLLSTERFPRGSISLRSFRVKDRTFFNLFTSPEKSKVPIIESILARYPLRKFILVGDSGEKDPEVYGEIARSHKEQVLKIFIRNVPGSVASKERYEKAFEGVDNDRWMLFGDPAKIKYSVMDAMRIEN